MINEVHDAGLASLAAFDAIIDVRSPGEFAEDHAPGAVNLPVLSDAERAEVGTIYAQRSKFLARRIGAAYVSRNIAGHLEGALAERGGDFAPLIYCWRGGQRSHAMATVLSQVGWRVGVLVGGYRTYRRHVRRALYDQQAGLRLVLLSGCAGAGKTGLIARLAERGVQTLDLEALARHRGSLFGALGDGPQPGQKAFESALLAAIERLDPARPIVVEAESSRIGELQLPPRLWQAMTEAPEIELVAPIALRARRLAESYGEVLDDPDRVRALLDRLPRHHGRALRAAWLELAQAGDGEGLAHALLAAHYDPSYHRGAALRPAARLGRVEIVHATPQAQDDAAAAITALIDKLG